MEYCVFSKHLQEWDLAELGRRLKAAGFDGVDLTVRAGGHVEPEQAADTLPEAVAALKAGGVGVSMITTDISDANQPHARATLEAAAAQGIGYWKIGYYSYEGFGTVRKGLAETKAKLTDVAALSKELGLWGGIHNHSGPYIGSNLVHIRELLDGLDPDAIGSYYDTGHATTEGAFRGWELGMDELSDRIRMVAVKDMRLGDRAKDWPMEVTEPGTGWVPWSKMLARLKTLAPQIGPVSIHGEYKDLPAEEVLTLMVRDREFFEHTWESAE
jgi:sugar phosphate isomerase/epimerase